MRNKSGKTLLNLIAALLLSSAAIDATAAATSMQKRTTHKQPVKTATASTSSAPVKTTEAPPAIPASQKANQRDGMEAQALVPVTIKKETAPISEGLDAPHFFYEFSQPAFYVNHILIEHDAAGRGKITFARKGDDAEIVEPLEVSPSALSRIAAEWEALQFLDSQASYQADKQFPHLGTMRLREKLGTRDRTAEFNWTTNPHVSALVSEYRRLGEQQLFVFDINIARQYQPSDSVKLLQHLDTLFDRHELSDAAQLIPLLRDLSTDERIPLIARNQAGKTLKKIEK